MTSLQGRVAIVTGAARGIGLAIAQRLARDGARVAIVDLDEEAARLAAGSLGPDTGLALHADVTRAADVEGLVQTALDRWGRVDVLVNNAGITGPAKLSWEYSEQEWRRVLDVDLLSVFLCCRAVVPPMLRQGGGRIVNVASIAGKEGNPHMAAYSTAKAGVIGFTKALGKELATRNVYVNCVTPAVIETELLQQLDEEAIQYMLARVPMGRAGKVEEVAAMVAWLASDEASFSTGAVFDISGGRATY